MKCYLNMAFDLGRSGRQTKLSSEQSIKNHYYPQNKKLFMNPNDNDHIIYSKKTDISLVDDLSTKLLKESKYTDGYERMVMCYQEDNKITYLLHPLNVYDPKFIYQQIMMTMGSINLQDINKFIELLSLDYYNQKDIFHPCRDFRIDDVLKNISLCPDPRDRGSIPPGYIQICPERSSCIRSGYPLIYRVGYMSFNCPYIL